MKRALWLVLLCSALILSQAVYAERYNPPSYVTAMEFRSFSKIQQLAYVAGVIDAVSVLSNCLRADPCRSYGDDIMAALVAFEALPYRLGQSEAIATKFINEHPEGWHMSAAAQVMAALFGSLGY